MPKLSATSACDGRPGSSERNSFKQSNSLALPADRIHSPAAPGPAPTTSTPIGARKFVLRSTCPLVQDRHACARAIHPTEPMLGPRRVSLRAHGAWPSPRNFSANEQIRTQPSFFSRRTTSRSRRSTTTRKNPGSGPALPLDCSHCASRSRKAATSRCGKVFRAPPGAAAIHPNLLKPRSSAWS